MNKKLFLVLFPLILCSCNNSSADKYVGEDKYYLLPGSYINKEANVICEVKTLTLVEFCNKKGINAYYDVNIGSFYELIFTCVEDSPFSDFYFSYLKKVPQPHAPTWYKDDKINQLFPEYPEYMDSQNHFFFTILINEGYGNGHCYHFEKNFDI